MMVSSAFHQPSRVSLASVLVLVGLSCWPSPTGADPATDVPADCTKRYEAPVAQRYCIDVEEAAHQRVLQSIDGSSNDRTACAAAADTWTAMEVCLNRARRSQSAWELWSLGGEVVEGRLYRDQRWQLIGSGFPSSATCEDAIAIHLNGLTASNLMIERRAVQVGVTALAEPAGSRDRFVASFADGHTFSWTFHCVRANAPSISESP
jgi:hypothetical protein